jgi:hypothetical protein
MHADTDAQSTGAREVRIFDHKVRRGPSNWHSLGEGNSSQRGGLHRVHVDQSYAGAEFLLRHYYPDEDLPVKNERWQIINARAMPCLESSLPPVGLLR